MKKLDHIDEKGKINMVDNTAQPVGIKEAKATGFIHLKPETIILIKENELEKAEILTVAEIAGIQAAKNTFNLIPLIHSTSLNQIDVKAYIYPNGIEINSYIKSVCQSGLETEAITAVTVALLTIFEFCKAVDSSMIVSEIKILHKSSGT